MTDSQPLRAPFPWFGGKRRVAHIVWERLGDVKYYVEPFFGGGAVLLGRPDEHKHKRILPDGTVIGTHTEIINDKDGLVANFWRAVAAQPDDVARWADWPVTENDMLARNRWLIMRKASLPARLSADPNYYDVQIAGWWLWGICCWPRGGWCLEAPRRMRPDVAGRGVHASKVDACYMRSWLRRLQSRLRYAKILCGDWARAVGSAMYVARLRCTVSVFLDPPYCVEDRNQNLYLEEKTHDLGRAVAAWCLQWGQHVRIALCGYEGEYPMLEPAGWGKVAWDASGWCDGTRGTANRHRERIWFSPACLAPTPEATT